METQNKVPPRGSAVVVFDHKTGKVLGATRRNDFSNWGLPGGKADPVETPLDCAKREFKEETGVELMFNPIWIGEKKNTNSEYVTDLFMVEEAFDAPNIQRMYPDGEFKEIEPGIRIGFVDYHELLKGSFSDYNGKSLSLIFRYLLTY